MRGRRLKVCSRDGPVVRRGIMDALGCRRGGRGGADRVKWRAGGVVTLYVRRVGLVTGVAPKNMMP